MDTGQGVIHTFISALKEGEIMMNEFPPVVLACERLQKMEF